MQKVVSTVMCTKIPPVHFSHATVYFHQHCKFTAFTWYQKENRTSRDGL